MHPSREAPVTPAAGQQRAVIDAVRPEVDGGRFPIKRTIGETVIVEADAFGDGHDLVSCRLLFKHDADERWTESPMTAAGNDRYRGEFRVSALGRYRYTVEAWIDPYRTWRADLIKRVAAGQQVDVDLLIGAAIAAAAGSRAEGDDAARLRTLASALSDRSDPAQASAAALDNELARLVSQHPDRALATRYERELEVVVDRERARFSTWYELFPRSCSPDAGRHGRFRDCEAWLPRVAAMGFDVLYLPPIHPIGRSFRKGRNNTVDAGPEAVGSPWAIGAKEGGHTAVHPDLGTLEDFRRLVAAAATHGLEVALDLAFQCAPDHPYVTEHPEWFRLRPDGTIQYAENPPKKYQDIYPFDFESADWRGLWDELRRVVQFWIDQGIRIFRVDNPHTKPFPFWEWLIADVKASYPEAIFLSEAFTRPKVMYRLAKLGFSQSYTYFTWRNSRQELTDYFRELTTTGVAEYLRPNLWPNTPDILPESLQEGGRPAFMIRLILAATLGASYGIYGPPFETCENVPRAPGSEEYLNSEKYEVRHWQLDSDRTLAPLITRLNRIRRDNPALQSDSSLRFHDTDNPLVLCYSKATADRGNAIIVVVSLDAYRPQSAWVTLDLDALGVDPQRAFQVHELLTDSRYVWQGAGGRVELSPESQPAFVLRIRAKRRTERDFDYYL
jgi:starch synthase (maltosyl-transferring)